MPRFSLRSMLVLFAIVALWFSTAVDYSGNYDVRSSIVLLILSGSLLKTYCSNGRQRCFWLAFFFVLLVATVRQEMYAPTGEWLGYTLRPLITSDGFDMPVQMPSPTELRVYFVSTTAKFAADLVLATVAGVIGMYIYDQSRDGNK